MKKWIPVVIALVLIAVIGGGMAFSYYQEKYSYSTETVDLADYYGVPQDGKYLAFYLENEKRTELVLFQDGKCYFPLELVKEVLNDTFYVDLQQDTILYTDADGIAAIRIGENQYHAPAGTKEFASPVAVREEGQIYLLEEFLRDYGNYSLITADYHVMLYSKERTVSRAVVNKDSAVRVRGGIKSAILHPVAEGSKVTILEEMDVWSKVVTPDGYIGYIEKKQLEDYTDEQLTLQYRYTAPPYADFRMEGKVALGWHSIGGVGGNDTLESMVAETKGMNVIAPTWFSLCDNEGNYESFGQASYVERAHNMGLKVWGVLDDFNYRNVHQEEIDDQVILETESYRRHLIETLVTEAVSLGLDGINLDFELLPSSAGEHFGQFLRELSLSCKEKQLTLSIDNYVPFQFNNYYRRDIQGEVADYVIIMGYDEHWHGSGDPGSVASISYVSNGIDKTLEQVPKDKMINALPFYSIVWRIEGANVTDDYLILSNTADFLARISVPPVWDEAASQEYYEWSNAAATYKLWAETEESIAVKLSVMKARDIAGVGVWQISYGTPGAWALIEAYVNTP